MTPTQRAVLAEQPAEQEQAEPSPTSGMNIAQRILHVGGRNNAAGYVEFGSIQAVQALVRQVIRDLPRSRRIPDHELVTMYDESPSSDADMIAFAHDVMDAMIYNSPQPAKPIEIDWSQAGSLMDAAASAKHAGCTTGTTNWAAHVYRYMVQAKPAKRVPLTDEEIAALWLESICGPLTATKFASAVIAAYEAKNGITGETK